eukprot:CAMPEP_0170830354 /NCGR_PEP_ID=MMETSP0733-20121128/49252_1 /TAXON_ID=186038 /ORGANISM="Fragilariopsis kerguelensis, Strain L26-C5" /LENGTH=112 /DNA_ID=CAMNT_0011195583 /DNA_START=52 /DNA_END=387 /DNA_ORIENTATION=-
MAHAVAAPAKKEPKMETFISLAALSASVSFFRPAVRLTRSTNIFVSRVKCPVITKVRDPATSAPTELMTPNPVASNIMGNHRPVPIKLLQMSLPIKNVVAIGAHTNVSDFDW